MKRKIISTIGLGICLLLSPTLQAQQLYSLDECRQLALEHNAQMKIAGNKSKMARQEKKEATTNFFPSISLAGAAMKADDGLLQMPMGVQTLKMVDEGLFGGAFATLPIFAGGQIYNGHKLAKLGVEISELQMKQTQNEVTLTVDQYYWNIVVLNAKLETLRKEKR